MVKAELCVCVCVCDPMDNGALLEREVLTTQQRNASGANHSCHTTYTFIESHTHCWDFFCPLKYIFSFDRSFYRSFDFESDT